MRISDWSSDVCSSDLVESDESDGSFVKLPATIAVVTNIDPEHLDFHGSFESLQKAFESFVQNIPFYGFAAMCLDHPRSEEHTSELQSLMRISYAVFCLKTQNIISTYYQPF